MLRVAPNSGAAFPRIHIDGVPVRAWIERKPWRYGSTDWQLWFERRSRLARGKCQLRLEIESKLKAWLLQRCGIPLGTLSYEELRLVAEGKIQEALRVHAHGERRSHAAHCPTIPTACLSGLTSPPEQMLPPRLLPRLMPAYSATFTAVLGLFLIRTAARAAGMGR